MNPISQALLRSARGLAQTAQDADLVAATEKAAQMIATALEKGGTLFAAGNGGSAADAQHLTSEFVGKLGKDRTPLKAFSLTTDTSLLTAVGNDYGYEQIFSRQVEGLSRSGDVFVAFTTSGNSVNILRALEMCKTRGVQTILFTGRTGGKAKALASVAICAPHDETPLIQQSHSAIYHAIADEVEAKLVRSGFAAYR